jgi:hypothetical protein
MGIAFEHNGTAVVIDRRNGVVRVDPATGAQSIVSRDGNLETPISVAVVP